MRVRPLICLDAPVYPLNFHPRLDALAGPRASSSFQITRGLAAFLSTCHAPFAYLTMADGAWYFYACHLCDELDKTARDADGVDGVNSIGFLWFSRSRFLGASAVRRVSLSFLLACLVGDVVSSSVFGVASALPPRDAAPSSVHHVAPLLSAYRCIYRLAFLTALPRFASRPVPRVVERDDVGCRAAGVGGLLFLSVRCGIRSAEGVCCLLRDAGDVDVMRR